MSKPLSPSPLYPIKELSELMLDACVCDERNMLMFASFWGRDTAVQEFLGKLTLGSSEDGLDEFTLVTGEQLEVPVFVGNDERLKKVTTRAYTGTLFGSMVHLWLFDKRCVRPDKSNATALAILANSSIRAQRIWKLVQETCPLPLLDHWRDTVLEVLESQGMLSRLPLTLGGIEGHRIALDVPRLTIAIGDLIRQGVLDITPQLNAVPETLQLRRAA